MAVRAGHRLLFVALLAALVLGSAAPASATLVYETQWGSNGTDPGQFQTPEGIAGGAGGAVYVADSLNDRIQKFDANGAFLTTWGLYGTAGNGRFSRPGGVATDFAGNVYVADTGNNRIQKFDANGVFLAKFGSFGTANGQFNGPYGVATDATGNLWVADSGNNRIQKFDAGGNFLLKVGGPGPGTGNSAFNSPTDVAVDAAGDVYVTDSFNYRVKRFNSSGAFILSWGSQGSGPGQFNPPYGIEADASAGVLVSDSNNHRVQRFTAAGGFTSTTGSFGSGDGQFKFPSGVGSGSGKIYVSDSANDRVQRFKVGSAIVVTKNALPDDPQDFDFTAGGGLSPTSFPLDDDADNTLSNSRTFIVDPGSGYSVAESAPPPGWDLDSATCSDGSSPGNIDVSDTEVVTCTFTNIRRGRIVVVQDSLPDDPQDFDYTAGGGLTPSTFQLDDDGDNSNALSNTQAFDDVVPGSGYSVSQTTPAGWGTPDITCSDGSPAGNIDVAPGEVVTCTFSNVSDTAGRIIVTKDAQPDDPQDFSFTAGGGISPSSFQLDDDGNSSNTLSNQWTLFVSPGSGYSVTENVPSGWLLTSATCSDGSPVSNIDVSGGETVTCAFANKKAGSITVVKDAQPDGPQDFDFTAGGGLSPSTFQLDDDATNNTLPKTRTFSNLVPGGGYSLGESVPAGWELSATCSDGSPISNIDVAPGEAITCTFVNRKLGRINVIKDAQPNDPQDFSFTTGGGLSPSSFVIDDDGGIADPSNVYTFDGLSPRGGYSVSESATPGWFLSSATCSDGSSPSNIFVSPGEIVHCFFTNKKRGSITIVQDTQPDDPQDFSYTTGGSLSPSSFQLDDDGDDLNGLAHTRVFSNLAPGNYFVNQLSVAGWLRESATCSDGSPLTNINVGPDEHVTCTVVNSHKARIIVQKDARPNNPQDFDFTAGGGLSPTSFQLDDDANETNGLASSRSFIVDAGSGYSVAEGPPAPEWTLASADCSDGSPISNIDVSQGETVTCLFVNTAQIANYPRPKGATPLRVPLVLGYGSCSAPNRTHGPPLAFPSCNVVVPISTSVTIGTPDANGAAANSTGSVRYDVLSSPGGVDDTDVQIQASVSDVRCKAGTTTCGNTNAFDGSDYTGQLRETTNLRITDTLSADSATTVDIPLSAVLSCASTASTAIGALCGVSTSVDAVVPGAAPEGARAVWQMSQVRVMDGGADGDTTTPSNEIFMVQGYFTP